MVQDHKERTVEEHAIAALEQHQLGMWGRIGIDAVSAALQWNEFELGDNNALRRISPR